MLPWRPLALGNTKYSTFLRPPAHWVKIYTRTGLRHFSQKSYLPASPMSTMRVRNQWRPRMTHRTRSCAARTSGTSVGSRGSSRPPKLAIRSFIVRRSFTLIIYQFITSTSSNARLLNASNDLKQNSRCRTTRDQFT